MGAILTFDVGTTAIKTCIFSSGLSLLNSRSDEYDLITQAGVIEQDCEVYWQTMCHALKELGVSTPLSEISAICITTQGETLIPVDRDGNPLHRAVIWLDSRAAEEAAVISEHIPLEVFHDRTGLPELNGYLPLAKMLWFRNKRPEIYERTYRFLLLEDYLLLRLTGRYVTEKSIQCSTGWLDIRSDNYFFSLLEELELSTEKLPELLECGTVVGTLTSTAADALELPTNVKVVTGAMDQIAAALGGGGLRDETVTVTVGTAMAISAAVPEVAAFSNRQMTVYRGYRPGQFVLLPYCPTAGVVFKWLKDLLYSREAAEAAAIGENIYDRLCALADTVPAGANGLLFLPYFAGCQQPRVLPESKGVFFGLDLHTKKETMVRAVLESIGYMLRENLELLHDIGLRPQCLNFFGGGAKNHIWNQIIADISGITLVTFREEECGSRGAAMLAAEALGKEPTAEKMVCCRYSPDPVRQSEYEPCYWQYQRLFESMEPLFK